MKVARGINEMHFPERGVHTSMPRYDVAHTINIDMTGWLMIRGIRLWHYEIKILRKKGANHPSSASRSVFEVSVVEASRNDSIRLRERRVICFRYSEWKNETKKKENNNKKPKWIRKEWRTLFGLEGRKFARKRYRGNRRRWFGLSIPTLADWKSEKPAPSKFHSATADKSVSDSPIAGSSFSSGTNQKETPDSSAESAGIQCKRVHYELLPIGRVIYFYYCRVRFQCTGSPRVTRLDEERRKRTGEKKRNLSSHSTGRTSPRLDYHSEPRVVRPSAPLQHGVERACTGWPFFSSIVEHHHRRHYTLPRDGRGVNPCQKTNTLPRQL